MQDLDWLEVTRVPSGEVPTSINPKERGVGVREQVARPGTRNVRRCKMPIRPDGESRPSGVNSSAELPACRGICGTNVSVQMGYRAPALTGVSAPPVLAGRGATATVPGGYAKGEVEFQLLNGVVLKGPVVRNNCAEMLEVCWWSFGGCSTLPSRALGIVLRGA